MTNPPRAARTLAYVSVAMDRAAQSGPGAIHYAAATVLSFFYPDHSGAFDAHAARLTAGRRGMSAGKRIGAAVVRRAMHDNSDAKYEAQPPAGPWSWEPTPPAYAPPLEEGAGKWRPWFMSSPVPLRPAPPPRPGSRKFRVEVRDVYRISQTLTAKQREIAQYWADGPGTITPPGHWNQIAIGVVRAANLSGSQAARVFAILNTAQSDAFICAWDAKYFYWSVRPVTVIRRSIDPNWLPLLPTPPFPSYVSGHATTSSAASTVLGPIFPRRARHLRWMAHQAAMSRLYAGIHYRSDNDAGLVLGKRAAQASLQHYCGRSRSRGSCLR